MKHVSLAILSMSLACSAYRGPDRDLPPAYRSIAVPADRLESADARERGRRLFVTHCALCHGERGDGRGVRHEGFVRAPRNFTDAAWRRGTSPRRVYFAIREGIQGTAMPAWKVVDEKATWDLAAYVLSLGEERR